MPTSRPDELLRCDRCRTETVHTVVSDDEVGALAQCRRCGSVHSLDPRPSRHSAGDCPKGRPCGT